MSHSGVNGGKKYKIQIFEKYGVTWAKKFDSKEVACKLWGSQSVDCTQGLRLQRALDLQEDWLSELETFNYVGHGLKVVGKIFNQPLFFKEEKK